MLNPAPLQPHPATLAWSQSFSDPTFLYPVWPHLQHGWAHATGHCRTSSTPFSPPRAGQHHRPTLFPSTSSQMNPCGLSPVGLPTCLTSLLRPTSHAAAVEATAAATAAARPRLGSAGSCKKSGAATGCTSSEGKRPTGPWMVPSLQPRGWGRSLRRAGLPSWD